VNRYRGRSVIASVTLPDEALSGHPRQGRVNVTLETPLLKLLNGFRVVDNRYFVYTARTPSGGVCVGRDEQHLCLLFFPLLASISSSGINQKKQLTL
jgi:hypothetical protein